VAVACLKWAQGLNLVGFWFISVYQNIIHCRSYQAGIMELEWCVFLEGTRVERLFEGAWNAKTNCMGVHEWNGLSAHSLGGFQDLSRQFGYVRTSKEVNWCNILPVKLAGFTLRQEYGNYRFEGKALFEWFNCFTCSVHWVNGKEKAWRLLQMHNAITKDYYYPILRSVKAADF